MSSYAKNTSVSVEKSKAEIEKTIRRFGAEQFVSGWDRERAYIGFVYKGRKIKLVLDLPPKEDFRYTPSRQNERHPNDVDKHWEQACRQRWRELALLVKAKLVACERNSATFENEFLAYTCLPTGMTVSDWLQPQIENAIENKKMPKLLEAGL
jgi:hypothetical protein